MFRRTSGTEHEQSRLGPFSTFSCEYGLWVCIEDISDLSRTMSFTYSLPPLINSPPPVAIPYEGMPGPDEGGPAPFSYDDHKSLTQCRPFPRRV